MQGYNYVQRPALAQAAVAMASNGAAIAPQQLQHIGTVSKQASAGQPGRSTLPGLAISTGGRPRHMAFPAFPQVSWHFERFVVLALAGCWSALA